MKKFNENINLVKNISKNLKAKNKKKRMIFSIFLSNILVGVDLLIIYYFTSFFQNISLPKIPYLQVIIENKNYLFIIILIRFLIVYIEAMNIQKLRFDIESNLRIEILNDVFSRGNFSVADSYFYVNTLTVHISQFYQNVTMFFSSLIKVFSFSIFILYTNQEIFIYFIFGSVLLYFPTKYFTKLNKKFANDSYYSALEISNDLERVVDNLYLIKILNKYDTEIKKFKNNLDEYYYSQLNNQKYGIINSIVPTFSTMLILSVVLLFFDNIEMISLDVVVILLRLFQSLGESNKFLSQTAATFVHLEQLRKIEDNRALDFSNNFIYNSNESEDPLIQLKNINFKYVNSENLLFHNLSLSIYENTHVVITGSNGIGKSSLLGLISGVFYPVEGEIQTKTKSFSYVSAYPMIIRGTLIDNIYYGSNTQEKDNDLVVELLNKFKVFESIDEETLNRTVSNKSLSSGQMQKIAFVRALVSNPEVLILDESTSNLDLTTKQLIFSILEDLNLTIINSTHNKEDLLNYDVEIHLFKEHEKTKIKYINK